MGRLLTLDDLQKQFDITRDSLAVARREILGASPLPPDYSRDSYSFSYLRAERIGMAIISNRLEDIAFLPLHLDPRVEIMMDNKNSFKKWLSSTCQDQPDSTQFGNDFIHALTRVAVTQGWQSPEFRSMAYRIGELFHDLSCLIGLIYYGVWMAENGIGGVLVSDPYDLERTAREIADLAISPEVQDLIADNNKARRKHGPDLHLVETAPDGGVPPPFSDR
ncbi:MAG: hypothetical protein PHW76_00500 [Alphaproteobacteria bacterium]|nr:hypothetical protein [Alphaproteobacteria bacterium]